MGAGRLVYDVTVFRTHGTDAAELFNKKKKYRPSAALLIASNSENTSGDNRRKYFQTNRDANNVPSLDNKRGRSNDRSRPRSGARVFSRKRESESVRRRSNHRRSIVSGRRNDNATQQRARRNAGGGRFSKGKTILSTPVTSAEVLIVFRVFS